jgi:hypothetical protein
VIDELNKSLTSEEERKDPESIVFDNKSESKHQGCLSQVTSSS